MLTFFTVPKPFIGKIGTIQRNAIKSWVLLRPECEIILLGDEQGVAEVAGEFKLTHIPDIEKNEFGTPLLNSVFSKAQQAAKNELVCFINSDIILMNDFINAIRHISLKRFLAIGHRWDLDITGKLDFEKNWDLKIRKHAFLYGRRHESYGIDYFVFLRDLVIWKTPPFIIGRLRPDNWIVWHALSLRIPVVDMTYVATVIHQNHVRTYSSIGRVPIAGCDNLRDSVESQENIRLYSMEKLYTIDSATYFLTFGYILLPRILLKILRKIKRLSGITFLQNHLLRILKTKNYTQKIDSRRK